MLTRIYRWWLSGYPSEVLSEMLKSAKEGSLKERLIREILGEGSPSLDRELLTLDSETEILESSSKPLEPSLEQENVNEKPRGLMSKTPTRRELEALKKALGIMKGSIQYKKKVDKVYLVTYDSSKKGYHWKPLGRWRDLQNLIYSEALPSNFAILSQKEP